MAESTLPLTLNCKQCNYENEPERVYCHNCGSKLDRSIIPKDEKGPKESPEKARKRIKRMTNPSSNSVKRELSSFVNSLVWAAVVAAILQMARPAADLPGAKKNELPKLITSDMQSLLEAPQSTGAIFSEFDVNAYLKSRVKATNVDDWLSIATAYEGTFVRLHPGVSHIILERSLFGYPIYFTTDYRMEIKDGKLTETNIAGTVGRLAIHPILLQWTNKAFFGSLWKTMTKTYDELKKMKSVQIYEGSIVLISRGTSTPQ